ncbi:MAG: hypothetical protein M3Y53_03520 [Thermoproteota archaeon]|nr:hypothetical protein [Thermoproteota archaeon]
MGAEMKPNNIPVDKLAEQFSTDRSGVIPPDETKTCTVTNSYNPSLPLVGRKSKPYSSLVSVALWFTGIYMKGWIQK